MGVHANSVQLLKNGQPCCPERLAKNNMAGVNVIGDRGWRAEALASGANELRLARGK